MKKLIYVVYVAQGERDDYHKYNIFATLNKSKAEQWKDKYNRIIQNNKERIRKYYNDGNYDKPHLFWYNELAYDTPCANIREIPIR